MPGYVWACLQREYHHPCIPLVVLYHHTKYYLKWSNGYWDIQIWKIEQTDWPRAFRSVTREPGFSQTCSFQRMIENHNRFDFRKTLNKHFMAQFLLMCKKPIFGPFCPTFAKPEFSWQIGLCHFLTLIQL